MDNDRLGREMVFAAKEVRERFERMLASHGASLPLFILLNTVGAEPGASQRELAARMAIGGPTFNHHVARYEEEGLLTRTRDTVDRRVVRVHLTAAGERRHAGLLAAADEADAELRSWLGARDADALHRILSKLRSRLAEERHAS